MGLIWLTFLGNKHIVAYIQYTKLTFMSEQKIPSVGDWIITLLILSIPVVNFIVLIYWAASNSTPPIKANFAKAALVWILLITVVYIIFFGALIGAFLGALQ